MEKNKGIIVAIIAALGYWWWSTTKQAGAVPAPKPAPTLPPLPPPLPPLPPPPKQTVIEQPHLSLPQWQAMTPKQLAALPVSSVSVPLGGGTYNPAIRPVAIGDTGFTVWGTTPEGSTVVSMNNPSTYAAWEWY